MEKKCLEDICFIGDGAHASLKRQSEGILYLTAKNLNKAGIDYKNVSYIDKKTFDKHFTENNNTVKCPKKGDILYSIIGSLGGCYLVNDEKIGISSSIAIFRPNTNKVDVNYLFYYLKSKLFQKKIDSLKGGVAQGFLSLGKLASIEINLPKSLIIQNKIAKILKNYDDLIENNKKQIKLLEEATKRLYKEWFIKFNFPGHKNIKFVDGIPEGWRRISVNNCLESYIGGGWGKEIQTGKNAFLGKVVRGTDINEIKQGFFSNVPIRYHTEMM